MSNPTNSSPTPIEIFCSYAHEDELHLQTLHTHLSLLQRQGHITTWHDRQILPGTHRATAIDTHLEQSSLILLLVTPDFLASDYCYEVEMQRALQRHHANEARVLPIIVRPCAWTDTPFAKLAALPLDGKPITTWDNLDLAWNNVTEGIRKVLTDLSSLSISAPPAPLPAIWNIPYPQNPVFTGREKILAQLAATLKTGQPTALSQPQAISGLGGIGKTQIAIEYAYQYRQHYQAVLWALAATREYLVSDYITIAELLNLPEKAVQDQAMTVKAVMRWLTTHTQWLLILDNADDLPLVRDFIPTVFTGHLLLTTRAQAMGKLANRIEVETMLPDIGALFLLRRATLLAQNASLENADSTTTDIDTAKAICEELGGLPLALDQAGAYIEETQCSLSNYLQLYRMRRDILLQRRGAQIADHPAPVATTWSLSFEQIEQAQPAAADLLRLCAFLAPDTIPVEIITQGSASLGPLLEPVGENVLLLDAAIAALRAYSLISRDASINTISIHRLVQAIQHDAMDAATQKIWAERAVRAVHATLPPVEHRQWSRWERLVAHAQTCAEWIRQEHLPFREASALLQQTGWYLTDRIRYREAASLLEQAYQLSTQQQGTDHLDPARDASTLATLYQDQGKYTEAEPLLKRALEIYEQELGAMHPSTATSLNNLAGLYHAQGKYAEAEPLDKRALEICEQELGAMHPNTAMSLNNLAFLYYAQGKYAEAEPLYKRALEICEQELGAMHPNMAMSLNNLAGLYHAQEKYVEAEPLFMRALEISEHILGRTHPDTQTVCANYSSLLRTLGRQAEAEELEAEP